MLSRPVPSRSSRHKVGATGFFFGSACQGGRVALLKMLPGEPMPLVAVVIKRDPKTRKATVVDLKHPRK